MHEIRIPQGEVHVVPPLVVRRGAEDLDQGIPYRQPRLEGDGGYNPAEQTDKPSSGAPSGRCQGGLRRIKPGRSNPPTPRDPVGWGALGRQRGPGLHLVPLPVPVPEEVLRGRTEERRRRRTHPRALRGNGMVSGSERIVFDYPSGPALWSKKVTVSVFDHLYARNILA